MSNSQRLAQPLTYDDTLDGAFSRENPSPAIPPTSPEQLAQARTEAEHFGKLSIASVKCPNCQSPTGINCIDSGQPADTSTLPPHLTHPQRLSIENSPDSTITNNCLLNAAAYSTTVRNKP